MKKYDNILKRVNQIENKLGISYAKTDGKLYKSSRIFNAISVIYLLLVNLITFLSFSIQKQHVGKVFLSTKELTLLYILTGLEFLALVLSFTKFSIVSNTMSIAPLPVFTYYFANLCSHPDGLFGYLFDFYIKYLSSYVLILIFSGIMLFIAIRERIKVNGLYKKIALNLYKNYKNDLDFETLSVSDEDWEEFIANYNP